MVFVFVFLLVLLPSSSEGLARGTVTLASGKEIAVEISNDPVSRARGLSGRESLAEDAGMLFLFGEKNTPRFWMKGMQFPLDMIWISGNEIVDMDQNVLPESGIPKTFYFPDVPVDKVLEVQGGFAVRNGLQVGDRLEIELP